MWSGASSFITREVVCGDSEGLFPPVRMDIYPLGCKYDTADAVKKNLVDGLMDAVPSKVTIVRSDDGGELFGGDCVGVCRRSCIEQEFTIAKCPELSDIAERALGMIQNTELAARTQAPILAPHVELPPWGSLWAETIFWACDALNHIVTTSNPGDKSTYEMWCDEAEPASPHPFLRPGYFISGADAGKNSSGDKGRHVGGAVVHDDAAGKRTAADFA